MPKALTPFSAPLPDEDLLAYRVRRGYRTAAALGEAVNASPAVISRLHRGHVQFSKVVGRIRALLGISAEQMERLILNGGRRIVR